MTDGALPGLPRPAREVAPGAVLLPELLDTAAQRELLAACRAWALPPAGLRTVRMPHGGAMSVRQLGLGAHWYPYGYADTAVDGDGAPVKPFPDWLGRWARRAVACADEVSGRFGSGTPRPPGGSREPGGVAFDVALVNFYGPDARMGMHQDRDEHADEPVVSFSLGDTCVFRFGNSAGRGRPWADTELISGDGFVFGGPARFAFHGVPRVRPRSSPSWLDLNGRLNITVRKR